MAPSICQICGQRLCGGDLYSAPVMHFCIGLDGPAIVQTTSFVPRCLDSDSEEEEFHVVEKKHIPATARPTAALSIHNEEDLQEIRRLHEEIEHLRQMLPKHKSSSGNPAVVKA